ncbi:Mbeg1-like protein [Oceanobacillus sp. Castelsardo]|uniref:Mbeg1-like protein n=1 Tax=Oceanobacillus sp. Castelsardo TaxID=1851204 RepID=UPI000839562F|nr:Mbeg1-like protein [Oceanobacillus sp. Castelsardo]
MSDSEKTVSVSEEDMKYATDIAYLDLGLLVSNAPKSNIPGVEDSYTDSYTVGELLEIPPETPENYNFPQSYFDGLVEGKDTHGDELVTLNADKINGLPEEALDWKILETFDGNNQSGSGFYGTVIETGDGEIIVSFRGSEEIGEMQNLHQDWLQADVALIAGEMTDQQQDANVFIDELIQKGYFNGEKDIYFAGHSLGGNLAEHATFYAASQGVADKITKTISYDGPGFAKEYLWENRESIEIATENIDMKHIEQSVVGGILQYVPGIDYVHAKLKEDGPVQHSTDFVKFDKDGNVDETYPFLQKSTSLNTFLGSPLTEGLDDLISPTAGKVIVETVVQITTWGPKVKEWLVNEDGSLTTAGNTLVVGLGAIAVKLGPAGILTAAASVAAFAVATVAAVTVVLLAVLINELIEDLVEYVVNVVIPEVIGWIGDAIASVVDWAAEELRDFGDFLVDAAKSLWDSFLDLFERGPKAHATSTYIKVDTYKLKNYAERLDSLRARIRSVDSDLNMLYLTEGFLDILQLMIAEKLPTSRQMNKVINYMQETAEAFESAENKIMGV